MRLTFLHGAWLTAIATRPGTRASIVIRRRSATHAAQRCAGTGRSVGAAARRSLQPCSPIGRSRRGRAPSRRHVTRPLIAPFLSRAGSIETRLIDRRSRQHARRRRSASSGNSQSIAALPPPPGATPQPVDPAGTVAAAPATVRPRCRRCRSSMTRPPIHDPRRRWPRRAHRPMRRRQQTSQTHPSHPHPLLPSEARQRRAPRPARHPSRRPCPRRASPASARDTPASRAMRRTARAAPRSGSSVRCRRRAAAGSFLLLFFLLSLFPSTPLHSSSRHLSLSPFSAPASRARIRRSARSQPSSSNTCAA